MGAVFSSDDPTIDKDIEIAISVNDNERESVLDGVLVYRSADVMAPTIRAAPAKVEYTCDAPDQCSYMLALRSILHGDAANELKNRRVRRLVEEAVVAINRNPAVFPAVHSSGFLFQVKGEPCLYLRNGSKTSAGICGVVDLDLFRQNLKGVVDNRRKRAAMEAVGATFAVAVSAGVLCRALRRRR